MKLSIILTAEAQADISVYIRIETDSVIVIAVLHQHRRPQHAIGDA